MQLVFNMLTIGKAILLSNFTFAGGEGYTIAAHGYLYSVDINNDGIKELISAGFETQPNTPDNFTSSQVNIFGWKDGALVNITDRWLPNKANIVDGVADLVSGDFNGDGLTDIYLSGDADMTYQLNSYALINQGTSFKKISLGLTEWEHGVTSGDVNNDGYADVIVAGYLHPSPIYLGGTTGLTKTYVKDSYQNFSWDLNASGVAFGNFLGDGSRSIVVVDGGSRNGGTNLFKINGSGSNITIDYISTLPDPLMGSASHDIRARTMDFNHDGLDDVIVFSRELWNGNEWPVNSRIQFYLNKGHGVFDDVTSTTLIGYDTLSTASYNPIIADFNGDGLLDIFISDATFSGPSNSTAILIQQPNGTFVDSYRKELSALVDAKGGAATITKGPDGFWYLVSEWQQYFGDTSLTMYKLDFHTKFTETITSSNTLPNFFFSTPSNDMIKGNSGVINTAVFDNVFSKLTLKLNDQNGLVSSDTDGTDTLTNIQRLQFNDISVALDIDGNAGTTAKILGAVFGKSALSNETYVGIGLQLLDTGTSYQDLMQLALNAKLGVSVNDPTQVVSLLYSNIVGVAPDQANLNYFVGLLNSHQYTTASLGVMAADTSLNTANIDLIGLAQTGIYYV